MARNSQYFCSLQGKKEKGRERAAQRIQQNGYPHTSLRREEQGKKTLNTI